MDKIFEIARSVPKRIAVIENGRAHSYVILARMIAAAIRHLETHDLPAGSNAIVLARTFLDSWAIVLALRHMGLNTACASSLAVAAELNIKNVACAVIQGVRPGEVAPANFGKAISLPEDFFERTESSLPTMPLTSRPPGGYFMFTSGTTGRYKKVFYSGAEDAERNRWRAHVYSVDANSVFHLANFGLWTAIGARNPPAVWSEGGCVVYGGGPEGLRDFFRHRPTVAAIVPTMLAEILKAQGGAGQPDGRLVLNVTGGFLPLSLAELAVRRLTPNIDVLFGSTEVNAMMRARFYTIDDLHWLTTEKNGFEVVDEGGNIAPPNAEGLLRAPLRSYDSSCYFDDEETSARFYRHGCFYTGDLAVRREDGRIRVLGRADDVVNLRGEKTAAAPIEEQLQRRLSVDAVCLFSGFATDGTEQLVVALECDRRPAKEVLAAIAKDFHSFERVRFVTMKAFPRTSGGMQKVRRPELRKLVFNGGRDRD